MFLEAFYVVTRIEDIVAGPRSQLSGWPELEKQTRRIHLIKVFERLSLAAFNVVIRIEGI